jgi:hypothetical protein
MNCKLRSLLAFASAAAFLLMAGCNSGITSSGGPNGTPQTGTVNVVVSDDATEDWATIGVKVLSISLVPQGNGTPVSVYTAPATPPMINLVQLDQLGEILGNATVPVGTYTQAILTLGANNNGSTCDVSLVASADPEAGFDVPAGTTVPCNEIVIAGAQGTAPNMTVPLTINLETSLTVTASSSNALDLEFNLRHPALIVEHNPAGAAAPFWAVNFNGPVRHHSHPDLTKLILRHTYGQVASVAGNNASITIDRAFPVHPITNPETAIVDTNHTLTILADAANGTILYDLANKTTSTITDFSSVATALPQMYVRVAARYQADGTLVATRIYAGSSFDMVWKNPEGHVLHVNTTQNTMWVSTEDGSATELAIGPNTAFYFRSSDTMIGTGTTFFDDKTPGNLPNVARGFKVNATIDPLSTATPPVALTVEIDKARYDGTIGSPTTTDFVYTRGFADADITVRPSVDGYKGSIVYATGPTTDQQGNADSNGYYWWNFAFPTLEDVTADAVADFVSATNGSGVSFGGVVGTLKPVGLSSATWNDPAASGTWAAEWTVLLPVEAPLGLISSSFASGTDSFAYTVPLPVAAPGGTPPAQAVTVDLNTTSGSATLVYQVDRQGNIITITPQDISNPSTLTTVGGLLTTGVPVKVYGIPKTSGLQAYVLFYYTHTVSTK